MVINIKYHCFNDVIHFHLVRLTWPIMRFFCSLSPLKQKSHLPAAVTHNPPLPFSRIMDRGGIGNTRRRTTQRSRFVWPLAAFVFCFVLPHELFQAAKASCSFGRHLNGPIGGHQRHSPANRPHGSVQLSRDYFALLLRSSVCCWF